MTVDERHLVQLGIDPEFGCASGGEGLDFDGRQGIFFRDFRLPDYMHEESLMGLFPESALVLGME